MKSLLNPYDRREMLERLERLTPAANARWGRMNASQMLAHLSSWMQMAKGEIETKAIPLPLRYPPIKQFIVYWMPFPKGVPTAPELIARQPDDWAVEQSTLSSHIKSFENRDPATAWPLHPAFGKLTPRAWGVLCYRHTDHHFRQFGI